MFAIQELSCAGFRLLVKISCEDRHNSTLRSHYREEVDPNNLVYSHCSRSSDRNFSDLIDLDQCNSMAVFVLTAHLNLDVLFW